jgi:hypothetical protein
LILIAATVRTISYDARFAEHDQFIERVDYAWGYRWEVSLCSKENSKSEQNGCLQLGHQFSDNRIGNLGSVVPPL